MPQLIEPLEEAAIRLLMALIQTPSFSREEGPTADLLVDFLRQHDVEPQRAGHNVWAQNQHFDPAKPTVLLNSHHDTVKPGASWTYDPFGAALEGDRLTGLGSNDAGASAVSLLATFLYFYPRTDLTFNLVCAITAEEEISGAGGIRSVLPLLPPMALGIVGEPTQMDLAIAEKGLVVLDCVAHGRTGHAARNEGENALYKALDDISWIRQYQFPEVSLLLGPVKMTVTQISAGTQHNVVPDRCPFVVDVRTNECYTNAAVVRTVQEHVQAEVTPRSTHLNSSRISPDHPLVRRGLALGHKTFGSATLSDQSMMPFDTVKIGPGDSARSHTPDEYILLSEIRGGIRGYVALLDGLVL
ncbi:M20/M25/M40 family metallo-hydrolase [Hymenobacter busanensis]|uniref:M20/M25/M40 family metallo-hydrolase n=1 Tax=Hymenobacter busanensis TaxID=2607656 RepID=A0A7L5A1E6_9BACT|nr:M20 family metallo-hydrolase [Hymenobacter busanensis]KAA9338467.1 M20/M25/M40 family metallo-hydrolase [Hymenobacter busanensis]QHJ09107.1 M20/M25/M40 family metallo-hydrolase [Hymenobacter busanensis]